MLNKHILALGLASAVAFSPMANAALITFDTVVTGATSFGYDGDGDGVNDVIFSTTDPSGFNTVGPGPNMSYINEPGIEGTTLLSPDLGISFLNGAVGTLGFGFAMDTFTTDSSTAMTFSVFDAADALLASTTVLADFTVTSPPSGLSSFPEALVSLSFLGTASYATFDFNSTNAPRYIIDNFTGTFGSTERPSTVPEPATVALFALGLTGLGFSRRRRAN